MPRVGRRERSAMPVFAFRGRWSKMDTPVVSEPVPEVVGTGGGIFSDWNNCCCNDNKAKMVKKPGKKQKENPVSCTGEVKR